MFPNRIRTAYFALALATAPLALCHAQYEDHCGPFCEGCSELRYFEPVDLDLDCLPVDRCCGYTFAFDKLYLNFTGEKTTIGAPGLTDVAEFGVPYNQFDEYDFDRFPNDFFDNNNDGVPDLRPYTVINGIQDAPPNASFGWGERIELGYFTGNHTYSIGILQGPSAASTETYGFLPLAYGSELEDIDGDGDLDIPRGTGVIGPVRDAPSEYPTPLEILVAPTLNGFGSVHVNFDTTPGYLLGFRDYWEDLGDVDGDDVLLGSRIVIVGPDLPADGSPDDIDGEGGYLVVVVAIDPITGDEVVVGVGYDFSDLHKFNVRFNTLQVRNRTNTDGVELMQTIRLDNRHYKVKHQNAYFEIGYGLRYFRLDDDFRFDGLTDIMGRVFTITQAENSIVGPQVRLRAARQVAKWTTSVDTRFMFGYNITNVDQTNGVGDDAVPGGVDNLIFHQPTYSRYGVRADQFSPFVEFRAEVKYQVTQSLAVKAGLNASYVGNLTRASQVVEYRLPDMGIGRTGEQDIFMTGLSFGTEWVH